MSRESRLHSALPAEDAQELVQALAAMPSPDVDLVVRALRAAKRAGREEERELRRRQHRDIQRFRRTDDAKIADAANQMAKSLAKRAGGTMETLALLKAHYDDGPKMLTLAVEGARSQGYSDAEIGRALGVTGSAVGERYGRRAATHPHTQGAA